MWLTGDKSALFPLRSVVLNSLLADVLRHRARPGVL
jgi:hypothetical protein